MPMIDDDLDPRKPKSAVKNLDKMSLSDLDEYILALKAEITRAEAEITKKKASMNAAANFFKTKEG